MAFANKYRQLWFSEVAIAFVLAGLVVASTGILFYFGNGLNPLWPLMWIAPLPVLLFALRSSLRSSWRSSWWASGLTTTAAMMVGSLNLWRYFSVALNLPGIAWLAIFLPASIAFALAVLLFRVLVLRGAIWSGLVALPSVWVTLEYLRNLTTPHGSAGALAYSQLRFLPFLQLASITGPWGMSFVLLLFPAGLAIAWHLRKTAPKLAMRMALTVCGIVAAVLVFGAVRLAIPSTQMVKPQFIRVGLIASDLKANANVTDPGADTERLFREYGEQAQKLAAAGAKVIVIPEKLGVAVAGKDAATDSALQTIANQTGVTIVAGVVAVESKLKYNQARIYQPGAAMLRYDKQHMLPPFESSLKPGTMLTVLPRAPQTWGVAICKDMDFASPARLYGQAGVGMMLVPAWDFFVDGSWHGHIAIMRGVEDGFSVVRAAKGGFLTVSDNRGRILGEVSSSAAPFATLLVDVPAEHSRTVYQALGDWFAWVCVGLLALVLLRTLRLPKIVQR